jgi:hypothetical protein
VASLIAAHHLEDLCGDDKAKEGKQSRVGASDAR